MIEIACLHCGLVNEDARDEGGCRLCGARLSLRQIDPLADVTFGADYKKLPLGQIVERSLFRLTGGERLKTKIRTWGVATLRRAMGRPWIVPLFKGRVYRFRPVSLTEQAPVDRNEVDRLTAQFTPFGFESVMDRMIESAFAPPFERLLVAKGRRLYATIRVAPGSPPALGVWAPQGKEGMTLVSDTPRHLVSEPSLRVAFTPGATVESMIETAESMTTVNDRTGAPFGVKEFSIWTLDSHERLIDEGAASRVLRKMRTRRGRLIDDGIPPSCAHHRTIRATRECLVCGKPLCDLCVRQVAEGDYCADHLPDGALPPGEPAVDLTGELRPAGPLIRLALAVGEPVLLLWGMTQIFPADGPAGSQIAALGLMAFLLPFWFLYPLARWGATPLGRVAGVAMVDVRGELPSWPAALVKTGGLFLTAFTILPVVGFLPVFWDKHRRSWADRMAGVVTVTTRPGRKELVGLLVIVSLVYGGSRQQEPIIAAVDRFFTAGAIGGGGGRIGLDEIWRLNTTIPAIRHGDTLYLTDSRRLGAIGIADRAIRWETTLDKRADQLYYDGYGRAVGVVIEGALQGYDAVTGSATYRIALPGPPSAPVTILPRGLVVVAGNRIVCVDRGGERLWERESDLATNLVARHQFLFMTVGDRVERLDPATGATIDTYTDYRQVAPFGDSGMVMSGQGKVGYFSFATGKVVWEGDGNVTTGVDDLSNAALVSLTDRLLMADDGAERFRFPANARLIGAGGRWVVTVADGGITILDAINGTTLGAVPETVASKAVWIGKGQDRGGRFVLVNRVIGGGGRVSFLRLSPHGVPTLTPIGKIDDIDARFSLVGDDRLLIIEPRVSGLYRLP